MDKLYVYALSAVLVAGAALAVVECSSSVCGNSIVESGEQCDKGDQNGVSGSGCSADCKSVSIPIASVQVSFELLQNEAPGYSGSTCFDLGVKSWKVHLDGPTPKDDTLDCQQPSQQYANIMPGTYQATITLLDASGNALTKSVMTPMVNAQLGGTVATLDYNFKQSDFTKQDYTGTLYFMPNWGMTGGTCAQASLTQEALVLTTPAGQPVTGMTSDGLTLDGTFGTCFVPGATESSEKLAMQLPWGHYDLAIEGRMTSAGVAQFCTKFDVFVGPGATNSAYQLVVLPPNADLGAGACP